MKKYFLLLLVSIFLSNPGFSETKYWIGSTGTYSNGANWNTMSNGSGTSGAPINTDDIVIDRNATITIDGTYFPSSVWIINNAVVTFINNSTSKTYTIGGGVVNPAFKIEPGSNLNIQGTGTINLAIASLNTAEIYGTLDFTGSSSKLDCSFGAGIARIKNGGKIRYGGSSSGTIGATTTFFMEAGSIYEVYRDGGAFPTGTYDPNSLLFNTGAVNSPAVFSMNSSTGSYGNYEFNSPSYTGSVTGINQNITLNNITISDDGSGKWIYSTTPATAYTLTLNGNVNTATGTTLVINNASSGSLATTLLVKGNISNNGLITSNTGNTGSVIEIGGNNNSTFSSAANGITNDISLRMNKSAGTLTALTDINLPNSPNARLNLSNGNIDMLSNNKILFIQNPAANALVTGSAASHIIGKLKRSSNQAAGYNFPVSNDAAQWAKAIITTNNSNATDWTVEFIPSNANSNNGLTPGVIDVVTNYVWNISRSGASPADAGFLTLFYSGLTAPGILIPAQAKVVHWNGTTWDNLGGADGGGSLDNTFGSTGGAAPGDPITTFSPFAIGGVIGVIPISLEYFRGIKNNNGHALAWKAACSGTGNITFAIERSLDGSRFNTIETITASTIRCLQPFEITDNDPLPGLNYYRIKITDLDGKISYSNIVTLHNRKKDLEILSLSPNPLSVNGYAVLQISSAQKDLLKIMIHDMTGKKVLIRNNLQVIAGYNQIPISIPQFVSGSYQLTVIDAKGNKFTRRFVKE